ncbi:hypothetical protein PGT21_050109 [Puccinia graminis f. sp. tritici]|uniref:CCHC-type domain-containing protein n=1 Tax=Puccinia graminis f. sp. tritici TaxID=56615 RepID=A0A5B0M171_PUCGR|nr:hypothetical protein PGT21_050109 [Puccinia graminis f. sp. tritici]
MSLQRTPPPGVTTRAGARRQAATRHVSDDEHDETFISQPALGDGEVSDVPPVPVGTQPPSIDHRTELALIRDGTARFSDTYLRSDGSNYRVWLRELTEVAFSFLRDERFFVSDRRGHPLERAARGILLGSVDASIRFDLYDFARSDAMLRAIKGRFGTISRATQLSRWRDLFHLPISADTNANEVSSLFRSRFDDLLASGIPLSRDAILGLILQSSIPHGTDLRNEFDQRMDMELSWNNNAAPRFDRIIDLLAASQARLNVRARDRQREMTSHGMAVDASGQRRSSIESHPGNVYGMAGRPERRMDNRPRTCFRCGSTAHQIADCTEPPRAPRQNAPHIYHSHPDQFTAHYPIITPPAGYRHPNPARPSKPAAPVHPAPGLRPADSYRPDYRRSGGRPAARQAEAEVGSGEEPEAPADAMEYEQGPEPSPDARNAEFRFPSPPPEALFDTGATHHLSGDNNRDFSFPWAEFNHYRA